MSKKQWRGEQRLLPLGADGIEACRAILRNSQAEKVNEVLVDSFSASAIVAVYDALSAKNRQQFESMPVARASQIAFKLLRRQSA